MNSEDRRLYSNKIGGILMIVDDIESQLAYVADKMLTEKCSEIQHIVELGTGDKFKFHIRRLKKERQDEELIQDAERTIKKIEKVLFRG